MKVVKNTPKKASTTKSTKTVKEVLSTEKMKELIAKQDAEDSEKIKKKIEKFKEWCKIEKVIVTPSVVVEGAVLIKFGLNFKLVK